MLHPHSAAYMFNKDLIHHQVRCISLIQRINDNRYNSIYYMLIKSEIDIKYKAFSIVSFNKHGLACIIYRYVHHSTSSDVFRFHMRGGGGERVRN